MDIFGTSSYNKLKLTFGTGNEQNCDLYKHCSGVEGKPLEIGGGGAGKLRVCARGSGPSGLSSPLIISSLSFSLIPNQQLIRRAPRCLSDAHSDTLYGNDPQYIAFPRIGPKKRH